MFAESVVESERLGSAVEPAVFETIRMLCGYALRRLLKWICGGALVGSNLDIERKE